MAEHKSLPEALAAFQADLPTVGKGKTAKVDTKGGGSYSYDYADLADVSAAVHPKLAEHGLSFASMPTFDDGGRFVLAYRLLHVSGESLDGAYPLPNATPQQVGSAITYARRYCLCAVTGVAPDEDDDGQAAEQAARRPNSRSSDNVTTSARPQQATPPPAPADESPADAIVRIAGPDMNALAWFLLDRFDTAKVAQLTPDQQAQVLQLLQDDRTAVLAEGQRKAEEAAA